MNTKQFTIGTKRNVQNPETKIKRERRKQKLDKDEQISSVLKTNKNKKNINKTQPKYQKLTNLEEPKFLPGGGATGVMIHKVRFTLKTYFTKTRKRQIKYKLHKK